MSTVPTPNRGEVWLVDFDPAIGAEIQKVRPILVISVDSIGRLPLRIVPLTAKSRSTTASARARFVRRGAASKREIACGGRDEIGRNACPDTRYL
jgi:mRNA-degrading endonuclease toxin of MazEF toxin-antitoxin module